MICRLKSCLLTLAACVCRLHVVQFAVFIDIALRRCVVAAKWEETSSSDREPIFLEQRCSIT